MCSRDLTDLKLQEVRVSRKRISSMQQWLGLRLSTSWHGFKSSQVQSHLDRYKVTRYHSETANSQDHGERANGGGVL